MDWVWEGNGFSSSGSYQILTPFLFNTHLHQLVFGGNFCFASGSGIQKLLGGILKPVEASRVGVPEEAFPAPLGVLRLTVGDMKLRLDYFIVDALSVLSVLASMVAHAWMG